MSDRSRPQRRVSRHAAVGRTHGRAAVARMGVALRDARRSAGLKQSDVAARAGVTQSTISRLELGLGATATIDTWARVVAGVGQQLAVFIERASGADRPRDFEHLRRQQLVIAAAQAGGWVAKLEVAVDPAVQRSRSIDVVLARESALNSTRETVVVEVWDWIDDVGAAIRSSTGKVAAIRAALPRGSDDGGQAVGELWVLRGTRRNRALVASFEAVFASRFPESGRSWMAALTSPDISMPMRSGLIWTDVPGTRLLVGRARGTMRNGPTD
jgi:transcriptional regulator with XRE-family HTH domain